MLPPRLSLTPTIASYVPGETRHGPAGGESALLDELERLGLRCEPSTQLVCVCEARLTYQRRAAPVADARSKVCGRPSTKTCYVCTLLFCEFCTRKLHWKARCPTRCRPLSPDA